MSSMTLLLSCVAYLSCAAPSASPRDDDQRAHGVSEAYGEAVAACRAGDEDAALRALRSALAADPAVCQRALLEPAFEAGLRDHPAFRDAVAAAAVAHGVSRLVLAGPEEPGEWIEVDGRTIDAAGAPVAGAVVRLFAADAEGRYHPVLEGERVPRIFGTVVSDEKGRFGFRTVRPGPYPGTRNARHVHVAARAGELRLAAPGYVVFDDDPLLAEPQNAEQRGEALRIRMPADGSARGTLDLPLR